MELWTITFHSNDIFAISVNSGFSSIKASIHNSTTLYNIFKPHQESPCMEPSGNIDPSTFHTYLHSVYHHAKRDRTTTMLSTQDRRMVMATRRG